MKFSNHEPEAASFQLAPMIDIVFLLLIFFILTWNVSKQEVEANKEITLPTSEEGVTSNSYDHAMVVEIHPDETIKIGAKIYTEKQLRSQMNQTQRLFPDKPITIWADKGVTVEQAMDIFNICKSEGLSNVTIAAKPKTQTQN